MKHRQELPVNEVPVERLDIAMLPPLLRLIDEAAEKSGLSARRWAALQLARHFGLPAEKAVPSRRVGRPRKRALAKAK